MIISRELGGRIPCRADFLRGASKAAYVHGLRAAARAFTPEERRRSREFFLAIPHVQHGDCPDQAMTGRKQPVPGHSVRWYGVTSGAGPGNGSVRAECDLAAARERAAGAGAI